MADLPQNTIYGSPQVTTAVPTGAPQIRPGAVRYSPSQTYKYLAQIKARGTTPQAQLTPPTNLQPGTPEYESAKTSALFQYSQLLGGGQGVPLQTQFLPPEDFGASYPVPIDYGTFATPASFTSGGENLSWGTPVSPVIKNIRGDVSGQYIEDIADPNLLVKTVRGRNTMADRAILNGRPGFMYQIDHILPLALGGADTLANRQVLTYGQYDAKNRAQAVPYTLYAYGKISLKEAREMAMRWKDRDLSDVPLPNKIGILPDTEGRTGLQIAQDTAKIWASPVAKEETLREQIGKIPELAKNFGEGWLPDPIREFLKGAASGFTLGFIPYEQDEGEGMGSKISGIAGMAVGGIGSFMVGQGFLTLGLRAAGLAARGSIAAYRGVATARAIKVGLVSAEAAAELAGSAKTTATVFKSLNRVPGYLQNVFLEGSVAKAAGQKAAGTILQRMGKIGTTAMIIGQGSQFIQNKFNPYTISGQMHEVDATAAETIRRMVSDFAMGAAIGILPLTLKGTAGAIAMPLTLGLLVNPDDPVTAITDALVFGAIHGIGAARARKGKYLSIKPVESPVTKAFEQTVNKASYATLSNYAPEIYPKLKPGGRVPASAHSPEKVQSAVDKSIENITKKYLGIKATPEKVLDISADLKKYSKRIIAKLDVTKEQKLSFLEKVLPGKRREATATRKAQEAYIKKEFGKGFAERTKIPKIAEKIPTEGEAMSLQELFAEIKRVTISGRQMYKGGLTAEMRSRADIDDLLSYGKSLLNKKNNEINVQKTRFDSLRRNISQPADIVSVVDSTAKLFGKNSFNNSSKVPSGKYPINGDIVITGAGVSNVQKANAKTYFDAKKLNHVDLKITLTLRPDFKNIFEAGNKALDPKLIKNGSYSIDPHPEHSIQASGTVYLTNAKGVETGKKQILDLGMLASDARLNKNFHKDHLAFNKSRFVLEGKFKKLTPENHKDTLGEWMVKNDLRHLLVNIDRVATDVTVLSKQPFILTNINDAAIDASFKLRNALKSKLDVNPISTDISNIKNSLDAKQVQTSFDKIRSKISEPASSFLPRPPRGSEELNLHYKTTDRVLKSMEKTLDASSPKDLKLKFQNELQWMLTDEQAVKIFSERNNITVRKVVKMIFAAAKKGDIGKATKAKLESTKTYLESGILEYSPFGHALLDLPVVGKFAGSNKQLMTPPANKVAPTQPPVTQPPVTQPPVTQPLVTQPPVTQPPVTQPPVTRPPVARPPVALEQVTPVSAPKTPSIQEPVIKPTVKTVKEPGGIADKITKEYLIIKKPAARTQAKETALTPEEIKQSYNLAKKYIAEGNEALEISPYSERGYVPPEHGAKISNIENRIQTDLQIRNIPSKIIQNVKSQVRTALEGQSEFTVSPKGDEIAIQPWSEKSSIVSSEKVNKLAENYIVEGREVINRELKKNFQNWTIHSEVIGSTNTKIRADLQGKNTPIEIINAVEQRVSIELVKDLNSKHIKDGILSLQEKFGRGRYSPPEYYEAVYAEFGILEKVQIDLRSRQIPPRIISESKDIVASKLMDLKKSYATNEPIEAPKFVAREYYRNLNENLKSNNPAAKMGAKAEIEAFSKLLGKDWQNDKFLPKILSDWIKQNVPERLGETGRDLTQTKIIMKAREMGIPENKFYDQRKIELLKSRTGLSDVEIVNLVKKYGSIDKIPETELSVPMETSLSKREIAERGLVPGEGGVGFKGMTVKTEVQENLMVRDLTRYEDLMAAVMSDTSKRGAVEAVRAVRKKFLGYGKAGTYGLKKAIMDNHPDYKGKKSAPAIDFNENSSIMKEAKLIDYKSDPQNLSDFIALNIKKYNEIYKKMPSRSLDSEIGKLETMGRWVKDFKEGEPLPVGITPEIVKDNVSDILAKLKKYSAIMKETEMDGGGGPGYSYDGQGGIESFFGNFWKRIRDKKKEVLK